MRSVASTLFRTRRLCPAGHEARLQYEHEDPADAEHDERVAEEPVRELPPRGKGPVLGDRQRRDVSHATSVEVACGRMVHGMLVLPAAVRKPHASPNTAPNMSFARRERMNDPCVQSWNTMNVRTRNAEAGKTSTSDNHTETRSAKNIATSNARYGSTEVARSSRLRPSRGSA